MAEKWGPCCGIGWTTPHCSFEKEKRRERKIKGHRSTMFYFLSLSRAHSLPAFSKRNVRPEVCVLNSSTKSRLGPDLGNINNSLERYVCEWECSNNLLLERLGNTSSGKVGQRTVIRVIGCKRGEIKERHWRRAQI